MPAKNRHIRPLPEMENPRPLDLLREDSIPVHFFAAQLFCETKLDVELREPDVIALATTTNEFLQRSVSRAEGQSFHSTVAEGAVPVSRATLHELLQSQRAFTLVESSFHGQHNGVGIRGRPDAVYFNERGEAQILDYKVRTVPNVYESDFAQLEGYGFLVANSMGSATRKIRLTSCVVDPVAKDAICKMHTKARAELARRLCSDQPIGFKGRGLRRETIVYDDNRVRASLSQRLKYWLGHRRPIPTERPERCRSCLVNAVGRCSVARSAYLSPQEGHRLRTSRNLILISERNTGVSPIHAMHGMQDQIATKLISAGIDTLEKLANTSCERVGHLLGWKPTSARAWPLRARALLEKRPIAMAPFPVTPKPRVYLDIETDHLGGGQCIWAVAILDERTGLIKQWRLRRLRDQVRLLRSIAKYFEAIDPGRLITFSGSYFDERLIVSHLRKHDISVPECLKYVADIYWDVCRSIALPGSYRLKEMLQAFGISHAMRHTDGRTVAIQAMRTLHLGQSIPNDLFHYNREDVQSLPALVRAIEDLCGSTARKLLPLQRGRARSTS